MQCELGRSALRRVEMTGKAAEITKAGLRRNLKIADELGVLEAAGLADIKGEAQRLKAKVQGKEQRLTC